MNIFKKRCKHKFGKWKLSQGENAYQQVRECKLCGYSEVEIVNKKCPHNYGEWKVLVQYGNAGAYRERICEICSHCERHI